VRVCSNGGQPTGTTAPATDFRISETAFAERCSQAELEANTECGGFFLHGAWLTRKPGDVGDEMTFALSYDTSKWP
jgi:hypothetical protein